MAELPSLLDAIREKPGGQARWLALSWWLWTNEREDEAAVVRVFWPMLRDHMTRDGKSLDETLDDVARNAKVLGEVAREIEDRGEPAAKAVRSGRPD